MREQPAGSNHQDPIPDSLPCTCTSLGSCSRLCACVLSRNSCVQLRDPLDCSPLVSSVHGILQVRLLEWGCHTLLQGIFPTQGPHTGLPHCRQIIYRLSHQRSPPGSLLGESDKLHVQQLVTQVVFVYLPGGCLLRCPSPPAHASSAYPPLIRLFPTSSTDIYKL